MKKLKKILWLTVWMFLLIFGNMSSLFPEGRSEAAATVYETCYGDQLSGVSRQVYDAMVSAWGAWKTDKITIKLTKTYSFRVSEATWKNNPKSCKAYMAAVTEIGNAVQSAYDAFIYDYPEVFWLSDVSYYSGVNYTQDGSMLDCTIGSLVVQPNERYPGAKSEVSAFRKAVAKKVSEIRKTAASTDRAQILRTIHDTLCKEVTYGNSSSAAGDVAHTAAGVFLKDKTVLCEGYAKAFKIICDEFQIPCVLIIGNAEGSHMWNYVRMEDGKWYLVDVTWDDQKSGIQYTYFLTGSSSKGYSGVTVGKDHTAHTDFSGSGIKRFVLPGLSSKAYMPETHTWVEVSRTRATCQKYGKVVYQCSLCGEKKTELLDKTGHSWGTYHSNQDATCLKDGTKTAECIYGCGKSRTVKDTGSKLKRTIKLNATKVVLQAGQRTTQLKIEKLAKGDSVVSLKSNNPSVVSVQQKGKLGVILKAGKTGSAKVTVTLKSKLMKTIEVVVQKKKVETKKITGVPDSLKIKKGSTAALSPVRVPFTSLEKFVYSSSNPKVTSVSSKGVVTGKKKGTAVITVTSGKISKKCKITVQSSK